MTFDYGIALAMVSDNQDYMYGRRVVASVLERDEATVLQAIFVQDSVREACAGIIKQAQSKHVNIQIVTKQALFKLVGDVNHQGVVAAVQRFVYASIDSMLAAAGTQAPLILVLDQIQDPHNLGSLIRSAYALGAHGVVIPKDRACAVTAAAIKVSSGAAACLPIAQVTNLRRALLDMQKQGLWVVGTSLQAPQTFDTLDVTGPTALVIGSEGNGMRHLIEETCDHVVHIPMLQTGASLNAAVAGAVCLYEIARQRRCCMSR